MNAGEEGDVQAHIGHEWIRPAGWPEPRISCPALSRRWWCLTARYEGTNVKEFFLAIELVLVILMRSDAFTCVMEAREKYRPRSKSVEV